MPNILKSHLVLWVEDTAGQSVVRSSAHPKSFRRLCTIMVNDLFLLLLFHLTEHDKLVRSTEHFSNSHFLIHYHHYMTREKNREG